MLPVPDTSGAPGKIRPALVVSADQNNARLHDAIAAIITKTIHRAGVEPTQFLIEIAKPEGAQSGLLHDSAVKCERLHAIMHSLVRRKIGSLPAATMLAIDNCLKAALELP